MRKPRQILVKLSEEEYEIIQQNAKAANKTPAAFMRELGMNFMIIQWNYQPLEIQNQKITEIKNVLSALVYTIIKSGEYVPTDLEFIQKTMDELTESQANFYQSMLQDREEKSKIIKAEVRKIIEKKLKDLSKK